MGEERMDNSSSTVAPVQPATPKQPLAQGGLWTAIAVVFSIVAVWLFSAAVSGSIALLANTTPSFDPLLSLLIDNMSSFAGVTIAAFGSVIAAVVSFLIFSKVSRTGTALADTPVRVGAAIAGIEAVLLLISAVGIAFAPLLTIREGMDAGSVYLVQFLPLMVASLAFGGLGYFLLKLLNKRTTTTLLSALVLIAAAVALIFGILAVVIKSHDDNYRGSSSSSSSNYLEAGGSSSNSSNSSSSSSSSKDKSSSSSSSSDKKTDSSSESKTSGKYSGETTTTCVKKYTSKEYTLDEYMDCYKEASGANSSSSSSSRYDYDY